MKPADSPADFSPAFLAEVVRAGLATWAAGWLRPVGEYRPVPAGWPAAPARPEVWPPVEPGAAAW